MKPGHVRLAAVLALPLVLAACGGASATPAPVRTDAPLPTPSVAPHTPDIAAVASPAAVVGTPVAASPAAAVPSPAGSPAARPTSAAFHADPALEERLPVLVEGQAVHVETVPVSSYLQLMDPTAADAHALRRFLSEIGSDPAAVTMAFAGYGSGDGAVDFQAYRAPGSRSDRLLAATVYLMRTLTGDAAGATVATSQVGNRTVTTVTGTGTDPLAISVFVEGEVAIVSAATGDHLAALLDALP